MRGVVELTTFTCPPVLFVTVVIIVELSGNCQLITGVALELLLFVVVVEVDVFVVDVEG